MTIYADYTFYTDNYLKGRKAAVQAADFDYFAAEASQTIKVYTCSNIDDEDVPECVKMCCCEIAEMLCKNEQLIANSAGLSSESVQGWSRSYESSEEMQSLMDSRTHNVIYKWLSGTGLLFRGI